MSTHSMYRRAARRSDDAVVPPLPYVGLVLLLLCVFRVTVAAVTEETAGVEVGVATLVGLLSAHAFISAWWERRRSPAPDR